MYPSDKQIYFIIRKQLKNMMIFAVMLAMLFLCENVSADSEGFNVGFMVKYGCYKKECWAYCDQSWVSDFPRVFSHFLLRSALLFKI